jgi:hypothetical protein
MPNGPDTTPIYKTLYVERNKVRDVRYGEATGANLIIAFPQVPMGEVWFYERIFIHANTAGTTEVLAYVFIRGAGDVGGVDYGEGVDVSTVGRHDIADEVHPPIAFPGETLRVRWEGLTAADRVACRIQASVRVPMQIILPSELDLNNPEDRELLGALTT